MSNNTQLVFLLSSSVTQWRISLERDDLFPLSFTLGVSVLL